MASENAAPSLLPHMQSFSKPDPSALHTCEPVHPEGQDTAMPGMQLRMVRPLSPASESPLAPVVSSPLHPKIARAARRHHARLI